MTHTVSPHPAKLTPSPPFVSCPSSRWRRSPAGYRGRLELEAKILFGRHIWEFAQHADVLGQRTAELRAGLHYTRRPVAAHATVLENAAELTQTSSRVGVVRRHRARPRPPVSGRAGRERPIVDQPSVRLIERILGDLDRLAIERRELLADITLPGAEPAVAALAERLAASIECADYRRPAEARA